MVEDVHRSERTKQKGSHHCRARCPAPRRAHTLPRRSSVAGDRQLDITVIIANQADVIEHRSSYGQTACRGDGENSSCRSKFDKSQKGNSDGIMVTWSISSETFGKMGYELSRKVLTPRQVVVPCKDDIYSSIPFGFGSSPSLVETR